MPTKVYTMGRSVVNFKGVMEVDTTIYRQIMVCHIIILYIGSCELVPNKFHINKIDKNRLNDY